MKGNPMSSATAKSKRSILLRIQDVLERLPISRSSLYAGMQTGLYPQPVRIGKRTVAWREEDIEACIAAMNKYSTAA